MNWLTDTAEDDAEHFTAEAFLNYQLESRGIPRAALGVQSTVVVAFQPYIYQRLVEQSGAVESLPWGKLNHFPLASGAYQGHPLAVAQLPVGAPAAVMYLETLATGGAHTVIAVGAAGSLSEAAPIGSAILPTSALREEGTSYHYAPPDVPARPHAPLVEALRRACAGQGVAAHEGPVWTTDAPFRELTSRVRRHAAAGVLAVDMEASALFIVGARRGLRVASLFVVSDELFRPWAPAFFDAGYRAAAMTLAKCALIAATDATPH